MYYYIPGVTYVTKQLKTGNWFGTSNSNSRHNVAENLYIRCEKLTVIDDVKSPVIK